MAAVKPGDVERTLRRLSPGIQLLLFYGPDAGRVSELACSVAASAGIQPSDPLQLVRLDGDLVADQPGRLVEEATTYGLFGERKIIHVRPTGRNIAGAVAACLSEPLQDTLIVIEAGDLARTSPLRTLCEQSPLACALPCLEDQAGPLADLVDKAMEREGLRFEPEARELLLESLGGDRLATRSELEKLALYCRGRSRIETRDVEAIVSNVSGLSVDAALDAAFCGDAPELEALWSQHLVHGTAAATMLSAAGRHTLSLLACRARLDAEENLEGALNGWRGLFFRRRGLVQRQVQRWSVRALASVNRALLEGTELSRRTPFSVSAIAGELLFRIAAFDASRQAAPLRKDRHRASS